MLRTSVINQEKKKRSPVTLNLVALMDIFTILVFFLLLNSGETQVLEDVKFVELPSSSSETTPKDDFVIHLGEEGLWLEEKQLATIEEIAKDPEGTIPSLSEALQEWIAAREAEKAAEVGQAQAAQEQEEEEEKGMPITIMADKTVAYSVLKTVMATCSGENFRDISLAVNKIPAMVFGGSGGAVDSGNRVQSGGG